MLNFIRALCVILFFAVLTACGGGGGGNNSVAATPITTPHEIRLTLNLPGVADPVTVDVTSSIVTTRITLPGMNTTTEVTLTNTVTLPQETITVTPPQTAEPTPLAFDAPELAGLLFSGAGSYLVAISLTAQTQNTILFGQAYSLTRQNALRRVRTEVNVPAFNREVFHESGNLVPFTEGGATLTLNTFYTQVAFQTRPTITALVQLCPISWFAASINVWFGGNTCPSMSGMSYTPNMREVVYAAMADGFSGGIGIGESPFAFSGRYDGDKRAAGFTYDWGGGYAFRTDYTRMPSKQDGEVWLDTFRFGALHQFNDEVRLYAGMDNYNNAIFAIDARGDNAHRLGFAIGDDGKEYAIKYELRLNL